MRTRYGACHARQLIAYLLLIAWLPQVTSATDGYQTPGIAPADILSAPGAMQMIDLRSPAEFRVAHIPGATNIPLPELEQRLDEIRRDTGVLVYCINGSRTRLAEPVLFVHGFERVYHLEGAFYGWIRGKHPVEKDTSKAAW